MRIARSAIVALSVFAASGCAVPQKPGAGREMRLVEPDTKSGYWLYLPAGYVSDPRKPREYKRWPVVVTLHGLRPYDNARWQNREWQEEADRYGFIVVAPELRTCDSVTMQFPLRNSDLPYVKHDERAILTMMDDVFVREGLTGDEEAAIVAFMKTLSDGYVP